jgi:hypothetical protein
VDDVPYQPPKPLRRKPWWLNTIWFAGSFLASMVAFLGFSAGQYEILQAFRAKGLLRPFPQPRYFEPAFGLSPDFVSGLVATAMFGPNVMVPILAAWRVRPRYCMASAFAIGWAATAAVSFTGFYFWEFLVLLPTWWLMGGVLGSFLSWVRRRFRV